MGRTTVPSYLATPQHKSKARSDISKHVLVDETFSGVASTSAIFIGQNTFGDSDHLDEDFAPNSYLRRRVKKRTKRGRGRPRISFSGRRPGRPRKTKTLLEGPNGPRLIQTTPLNEDVQSPLSEDNIKLEIKVEIDLDNVLESLKLATEATKESDDDNFGAPEAVIDNTRRRLPPRNRGGKYKKMIEALTAIHAADSTAVLIKDSTSIGNEDELLPMQQKLVITFEHPESSHEVMRQESAEAVTEREATDPVEAHIVMVASNEGDLTEEKTTLFVNENGEYHECHGCGAPLPWKREEHEHLPAADRLCFVCLRRRQLTLSSPPPATRHVFECDICRVSFDTSSGLNRHRKVHSRSASPGRSEDNVFRCVMCLAIFSFEESLVAHMQNAHSSSDGLDFVDEVDIDLEDSSEQRSTVEILQEKLSEGYAPKTSELYDEPSAGETVEQSASDPFRCGICDDPFRDIDVMCEHYSTAHMGDQSHYCNLCGVGCVLERQLESHHLIHAREEKMADSGAMAEGSDAVFPCLTCGRRFRSMAEMVKHSKWHAQAKQFACTYCTASFPIKSALDKHILVHTGQRPFLCDICLKSFRQSAALVRHKLWTHRLKNQSKCDICTKTFFTRTLLLYHLDTHGAEAAELKERLRTQPLSPTQEEDEELTSANKKELTGNKNDTDPNKRLVCEYCQKEYSTLVALLTHKITHKHAASFKCDVCHRTFREKRYLRKHRLTHRGLKVWKCDICGKSFATKLTLIRHSHVHIREALRPDVGGKSEVNGEAAMPIVSTLPSELRCVECKLNFSHKSHYVRHRLLHSSIPLLRCGVCDKMFVHKSDIIRHKVMHSFMFTCKVCNRNFHKRSLYLLHIRKHTEAKPFKCDKCGKCFATSGNFKIHQRIHSGEKPYRCNVCSYRCSQSGRMLKHRRMHTGEKIASCGDCGKRFSTVESLKTHMRLHNGERPFPCRQCEKSFTNNTSLTAHIKDHMKEETLKCDQCQFKFRKADHLKKHMMFHEVRKKCFPLVDDEGRANQLSFEENSMCMCDICGRVFEKKKYLFTHYNVHSRQKMFSCSFCGKVLASRLALKNHVMIHTGEMPHKCSYCPKEFRSMSNLKRHEKAHNVSHTNNSGNYACDECGQTFYSPSLLHHHKQEHVNIMMMNTEVSNDVAPTVGQPLYVFDAVNNAMGGSIVDATQQMMVDNGNHPQFLTVDNSQSLLVFPETSDTDYTEITSDSLPQKENKAQVLLPTAQSRDDTLPQSPLSHSEGEMEEASNNGHYIIPDKIIPSPLRAQSQEDEEMPPRVPPPVDKPFQCDVCFKGFAKKQYLTKHKYRHREVKPHACDECGKRFAQKFEVAVHKIKHTGARPYSCEVCQKEFRSKVNLGNHRMKHTGQYPFLCSVCNKGVATQLQLEKHVALHASAHAYRCDICNRSFSQRVGLVRHSVKEHNMSVNYEASSLESSMEVIEAISSITKLPPMPEEKGSMVTLVQTSKKGDKDDDDEISMSVEPIHIDELSQSQFSSVVNEQQDYLLGTSQEFANKIFTSIL